MSKHIYKKVAWLNELPADEAERVFRECAAEPNWARQMAAARPYRMIEPLFVSAEQLWSSRSEDREEWPPVEARLVRLLER